MTAPEKPRTVSQAPTIFRAAMILMVGTGLLFGFLLRARPELADSFEEWWYDQFRRNYAYPRNAAVSLKTITSAQADYRANDRDGNLVQDYWRGDIAGLYTLHSAADPQGEAIKLIEVSVASADALPVTDLSPYAVRKPKAGYWFRALLHQDERTPSPDRFAACAFPDTRADGKYTFIVDETNVLYRKALKNQRGIERYPLDPLREGWEKLD